MFDTVNQEFRLAPKLLAYVHVNIYWEAKMDGAENKHTSNITCCQQTWFRRLLMAKSHQDFWISFPSYRTAVLSSTGSGVCKVCYLIIIHKQSLQNHLAITEHIRF